jgi:hypothetical protein
MSGAHIRSYMSPLPRIYSDAADFVGRIASDRLKLPHHLRRFSSRSVSISAESVKGCRRLGYYKRSPGNGWHDGSRTHLSVPVSRCGVESGARHHRDVVHDQRTVDRDGQGLLAVEPPKCGVEFRRSRSRHAIWCAVDGSTSATKSLSGVSSESTTIQPQPPE